MLQSDPPDDNQDKRRSLRREIGELNVSQM